MVVPFRHSATSSFKPVAPGRRVASVRGSGPETLVAWCHTGFAMSSRPCCHSCGSHPPPIPREDAAGRGDQVLPGRSVEEQSSPASVDPVEVVEEESEEGLQEEEEEEEECIDVVSVDEAPAPLQPVYSPVSEDEEVRPPRTTSPGEPPKLSPVIRGPRRCSSGSYRELGMRAAAVAALAVKKDAEPLVTARPVIPGEPPPPQPPNAHTIYCVLDSSGAPSAHVALIPPETEPAVPDAWPSGDAALRARALLLLWALLGDARLRRLGFPDAPVDALLWRAVDTCCAVAGARAAAPVPLPPGHECGADMACFRDHAHRLLEVCAPTRDHWKRFGWAGLTVDAVFEHVYRTDLLPALRHQPGGSSSLPLPVRLAMALLTALEADAEKQMSRASNGSAQAPRPVTTTPSTAHAREAPAPQPLPPPMPPDASSPPPSSSRMSLPMRVINTQTVCPEGLVRKKRGRPAKVAVRPETGRVERVMLWRFLLNLLEEPRHAPCIHWVRRDEGLFRITNTEWLARLWGRRHGNPRMTYEKMARAMRTYYRSKVLQPVPRAPNLPRKLVYKFNPAVIQRVTASKQAAAAAAAAAAATSAFAATNGGSTGGSSRGSISSISSISSIGSTSSVESPAPASDSGGGY